VSWWRKRKEQPEPDWLPAGPGVAAYLIWHGLRRVSYRSYVDTQEFLHTKPLSNHEFREQLELYRELYRATNVVSNATHSVHKETSGSQWDREVVIDWVVNQRELDGNPPSFSEVREQFPGIPKATASKWRALALTEIGGPRRMAA